MDATTAIFFLLAGGLAGSAWRVDRRRRGAEFWLWAAAGLALLAGDELFNLQEWAHEELHAIGFGDPPYLNGIDDLIMLLGGLIGFAICAWYWRELVRDRGVLALLVTATAVLVYAVGIDALGPPGGPITHFEEGLELLAAVVTAAGMFVRWRAASSASRNPPAWAAAAIARRA